MRDMPRVGDRVQVRPLIRVQGELMGGAIGTIRQVIDLQWPGVRSVGLLVQTGVDEMYLLTLGQVTLMRLAVRP